MNLEKKRWIILTASCIINLCIGSLYAWSVFSSPMAEYFCKIHGLTGEMAIKAANLAIVFTVANAVGPITMITGGKINDSIGPKGAIISGGLLFGGGFFLSGFVDSIGMLVLVYGLGCGLGMGLVYSATVNNSVKLFPDKRGLIGGITTATYGLSSMLVPPIANFIIREYGVQQAFRTLGIAFILIILLCSVFIEKAPHDFVPSGMVVNKMRLDFYQQVDKNWREMLRDKTFYMMFFMLMFGAFSGLMIISQASPMAQMMVGMQSTKAAMAVSILAFFNAFGRIAAGYLSDKIGRIQVIRLAFLVSVVGLFLLMITKEGDTGFFMTGISIAGVCFGAFLGIFPGFTADRFGTKNNSVNYGVMFIGFALAGLFGPMLAGKMVIATQSYQFAFYAAAALAVLGLLLTFTYSKVVGEKGTRA